MMNSRPSRRNKPRRGPFAGLRKGVERIVSSKRFLLLVSLLAAMITWAALVASDGTLTREKVFQNVSVSVTGEATLKSRGYIVMDDLNELLSGVKMTVEVAQQNYKRASGTAYGPHLDLTDVTGVGENELPVSFSSQLYGPVVACDPASVVVQVERYITRRIPVTLEVVGEAPAGYFLDSAKTDPTMLSVSGPQSLVSSVASAVATLDASMLTGDRQSDKSAVDVVLQSGSGVAIESEKIEITNQTVLTDSVVVETELLPVKHVPFATENFVSGTPEEGWELDSVEVGADALPVAAKQEILDAIEFITTDQPLDIEGASGDMTGVVRIRKPSGAENTLPSEVTVTARLREKEIERTLRGIRVEIEGLGSGLNAVLAREKVTVQLTGAYRFISGLREEDIRLFVDVSGLGPGRHDVPVQIHIDNAQPFGCALSAPEISVTIRE